MAAAEPGEPTGMSDASARTAESLPQTSLTTVDLRLLDYVDNFDKNLMCPICHCPFIAAVRLASCDHTFCRHCLHTAFHNQARDRKSCPSCRSSVTSTDEEPVPRFIDHMIDDLTVLCPNHDAGCSSQMRRSDVQNHVRFYCLLAQVPCPSSDCRLTIARQHSAKACLHTLFDCDQCNAKVMELDREHHTTESCSNASAACKHCGETFPVREVGIHETTCSKARLECPAASVGCDYVSTRKDLAAHEAACSLVKVIPALKAMTRRIEKQDASIQTLRHKNGSLEASLNDMQSLLSSIPPSPMLLRNESLRDESVQVPADTPDHHQEAPFDSATHHLLHLHEALREELDRVSGSVTDLDGRISMMVINENLRLREEMTHMNAVMNSMRMQLQWLTSARLQAQPRLAAQPSSAMGAAPPSGPSGPTGPTVGASSPATPTRRLSDSSTKL